MTDLARLPGELPGSFVKRVMASIEDAKKLPRGVIAGPCRERKTVTPARHDAMAIVWRDCPKSSLGWMGKRFRRDHTTVLHALRKAGTYTPHFPRKGGVTP